MSGPIKIGFTGTRHELREAQRRALSDLLHSHVGKHRERPKFHHGACKGADALAAGMAWDLNYDVVAHPGESAHGGDNEWLSLSALEDSGEVRPTKTHFARNRDIVDETDELIACPLTSEPITAETKGGTAYTVNYARKRGKRVWVVEPNGTVAVIN